MVHLRKYLLLFVAMSLMAPPALTGAGKFDLPTNPVVVGEGTLLSKVVLAGFDDYPRDKGIHSTAPFTLCQLDGDNQPEFLVKSYKNGQPGCGSPVIIYAYDHDGSLLWERSMGENACAYGSWSPAIAYDMNGDGLDEVYIYHFPSNGNCMLARLNHTDGKIMDSTLWPAGEKMPKGSLNWRGSLLIAYLDGVNPSIVAITGYQKSGTGHFVKAYDMDLALVDSFSATDDGFQNGSHQYIAADIVGGDGKDELLFGSWYLHHDFTPGRMVDINKHNHTDGLQASDFLPDHPGIEIWFGSDGSSNTGIMDSSLNFIWQIETSQQAQAAHGDLVPGVPGWETAFDCCGGHAEPPATTRRIRYADGTEKTFAELDLDQLDVEHHNLPSDFPHWNNDYSVRLAGEIPGYLENLDNHVLARIKGDYFGDGREEFIVLDGNTIKIFAPDGSAPERGFHFNDDRKYRMELARGSRHFSAFHYTAPVPLKYIPALHSSGLFINKEKSVKKQPYFQSIEYLGSIEAGSGYYNFSGRRIGEMGEF